MVASDYHSALLIYQEWDNQDTPLSFTDFITSKIDDFVLKVIPPPPFVLVMNTQQKIKAFLEDPFLDKDEREELYYMLDLINNDRSTGDMKPVKKVYLSAKKQKERIYYKTYRENRALRIKALQNNL